MIKHSLLSKLVLLVAVLVIPATLYSTPLPQSASDVKVTGSIAPDKTKKRSNSSGKCGDGDTARTSCAIQ